MHEFSLATALCDIVLQEARTHGALGVRRVRCRVGVLRQVVPELMQTAFAACAAGTLAAEAALELEVEPVRLSCRACGATAEFVELARTCPACGGDDIVLTGGADFIVAALEIDQEAHDGNTSAAAGAGGQRCDGG